MTLNDALVNKVGTLLAFELGHTMLDPVNGVPAPNTARTAQHLLGVIATYLSSLDGDVGLFVRDGELVELRSGVVGLLHSSPPQRLRLGTSTRQELRPHGRLLSPVHPLSCGGPAVSDDLTKRLRDNAEVLRRYFPSTPTTVISVSRLQGNANDQAEAADHIEALEVTIAKLREAIETHRTRSPQRSVWPPGYGDRRLWAVLSDTEGD